MATMMAAYSEENVNVKLREVTCSQKKIESISAWMIQYKRHHAVIVKLWYKQLVRSSDEKRKALMFLANDIVQNSRRKGPEYAKEFHGALKKAYRVLGEGSSNSSLKNCVFRLCQIWRDRHVYDKKTICAYEQAFAQGEASISKKDVEPKDRAAQNVDKNVSLDSASVAAALQNSIPCEQYESASPVEAAGEQAKKSGAGGDKTPIWNLNDGDWDTVEEPADARKMERLIRSLKKLEKKAMCTNITFIIKELRSKGWCGTVRELNDIEVAYNCLEMEFNVIFPYPNQETCPNRIKERDICRKKIKVVRRLRDMYEKRVPKQPVKTEKIRKVEHPENYPNITAAENLPPLPSAMELFRPRQPKV